MTLATIPLRALRPTARIIEKKNSREELRRVRKQRRCTEKTVAWNVKFSLAGTTELITAVDDRQRNFENGSVFNDR